MAEAANTNGAENQEQAQFQIQRIYVKDISFEAPNAPEIFQKEWAPEIKLDLDTNSNKLGENVYEVELSLTVTATVEDTTAFLCEVKQAGIFAIGGMPDPQLAHTLGSFCPNMLFPYAREAITNMVTRGTYPQINLAPINFDALFASYVQRRQQEAEQANGAAASDGNQQA